MSEVTRTTSKLAIKDKDLDVLLRNPLLPQDEGFEELACERLAWWDSDRIRTWFREKGYTLYERIPCDGFSYGMYPLDAERRDSTFPFAIHSGPDPVYTDASALSTFFAEVSYRGNVAFAQDAQGQHVVMKAILNESEEHRILKFLHAEGVPSSTGNFNCIIPIIDLLPCEGHWIAIMPRWGLNPLDPAPQTIREVFEFIHYLLKGLTYLHRHRICHGDIKPRNILVSHVDGDAGDIQNPHRVKLRSEGKLVYALYDFDGSHMFPASISLEECRLPSEVSFDTLYDQIPTDTLQGEIDFNPFAFDVGMLGVTFCQAFQDGNPEYHPTASRFGGIAVF
ncbi:hypothetical protein H0H92_008350 [Tricholoma furcatifolium]|nr:hypothetical protein H0H92_008350 [Tricholoma furcatifolium]